MSPSYWQREWQYLPAFADLKLPTAQEITELVTDGNLLITPSDLFSLRQDYPNADL